MQISSRDRKQLIILSVVAAVAAVVFVLFIKSQGSKQPSPSAAPIAGATTPTPQPSVPSSGSPKPTTALAFSGRDPFQTLVTIPTVSTGPAPASPSPVPGISPAPNPSPVPQDNSAITIDGHNVVLDDIFTTSSKTKVQVEVDGAVYTVGIGETFASSFALVSVSGSTANFTYGDQTFSLTQPQPSGS
jgi:hypothetical protein